MTSNLERVARYISQIENCIEKISSFINGMSYDAYQKDAKTQDAVHMRLIVIGEAVNNLQKNCKEISERNPQIPWNEIRGMRNKIAHDYFGINSEHTWNAAKFDIPQLKDAISKFKESEPELADIIKEIKQAEQLDVELKTTSSAKDEQLAESTAKDASEAVDKSPEAKPKKRRRMR